MFSDNPYQSTLTVQPPSKHSPLGLAVWWWIYLNPLIVLVLIDLCWIITTISLGHTPRFGDEPNGLGGNILFFFLGTVAALSWLASPLFIPAAIIISLVQPFGSRPPASSSPAKRFGCFTLYLVVLGIAGYLVHFDPFGILYWFWD